MTLKQSTARPRTFYFGVAGLTPTVTISKAGGAFAAAAGVVSEISGGYYKIVLTTADTNTPGDLAFIATAAGVADVAWTDEVETKTLSDVAAPGDAMALTAPERAAVADRCLGRSLATGADGGRTVQDALRALRNRTRVYGGLLTVYREDDNTAAWTAPVATDANAAPIVEVDPL